MNAGKRESYEVKVFGLFKLSGPTLSYMVEYMYVKRFAPCTKILDSGFHAVDSGFSVSRNLDSGSQLLAGFWIPKPTIPDFRTKSLWIPDSTGKNFPRFWNRESLDEKINLNNLKGFE